MTWDAAGHVVQLVTLWSVSLQNVVESALTISPAQNNDIERMFHDMVHQVMQ
jgi:hypothetical protein